MTNLKSKNIFIILFLYSIILIIFFKNSFNTVILELIFWSLMIIYLKIDIKNNYTRFNKNKKYIIAIIIISSIYAILFFYIGFIIGFSKSPLSHDILIMLKNIIIQVIPIFGIEFTRSIVATRNKTNKFALVLLTAILIILEINYNMFNSLTNKKQIFEYFCSNILPTISCGILYTYLTLKGSHQVVLIYRFFKELIIVLLPIIPSINWFITGSIGVLSPCIIYVIFNFFLTESKRNYRKNQKGIFEKSIYILTIISLIVLVCFMEGMFKYEPIAILSNSMLPTISRGDVIIFKKLSNSELNEIPQNTIIIYMIGEQHIAHRVVDRVLDNNMILYQTKGDSNNVADTNLVTPSQIQGVYAFHIKYIGLPSVWLYEFFNDEIALVDTGLGG